MQTTPLDMLAAYASSAESGSDDDEANGLAAVGRKINVMCRYFVQGNCSKGDQCAFRHQARSGGDLGTAEKKPGPLTHQNRQPLLRKLLENDIRKEKNMLLQCIRYIVQNDFLGQASERTEKSRPSAVSDMSQDGDAGQESHAGTTPDFGLSVQEDEVDYGDDQDEDGEVSS
ncbi:hypothetical protein HK104_006898 [Borealophlyctis nickersoniae]|nr:hypothetical protein HK104_006898 [Borealophlyctis nickersoniae]